MAVIPEDLQGIVARRLDVQHLDDRFEHLEWIRGRGVVGLLRLCSVRAGASRARAFVAQKSDGKAAVMTVLPVDLDAFRFRNRDVLRIGRRISFVVVIALSRYRERRGCGGSSRSPSRAAACPSFRQSFRRWRRRRRACRRSGLRGFECCCSRETARM